jgi:3-deoxy-7-phosphoheptulonate synthase
VLIVMRPDASRGEIDSVLDRVRNIGFDPHEIPGGGRTAIGVTGNPGAVARDLFEGLRGIAALIPVTKSYKLVDREATGESSVIDIGGGVSVGGEKLLTIGGPCSVESREQLMEVADRVHSAGGTALRGGAFKPRTSPYAFQGLKLEGLELLAEARERTGLPIVTEVKDVETLDMVEKHADVLQIGARNMQNYSLLEAVGERRKPVLLKRGLSATVNELLLAAEYIFSRGNQQVILCERGIRTFETVTRNTLDLGSVVMLKRMTHLPVIVDPSHGMGVWQGVIPMARAAIACGADGVMVEVHPAPSEARSDGPQSLLPARFETLMDDLRRVASVVGRTV